MTDPKLHRYPAKEQDPAVCSGNFEEVSLGYDPETAVLEASRCLHCKNSPCVGGCPVGVRIPDFVARVAAGDFDGAYRIIRLNNSLPAICGRVCPQETQCESRCVRGIKGDPVSIGRLERFAADHAAKQLSDEPAVRPAAENRRKVAVVGSGPSGLTCAGDLARLGYDVHIFEALHAPGGVLVYGIPEFRLPKSVVRDEIAGLEKLGVVIETDFIVGKTLSIDELMEEEGYEAVFIGTGAGLPRFQGIPGENLNGVYSANEFLTRINLMKAYSFPETDTPVRVGKKVAVIGGGNVAMDAARCAKRLGAGSVTVIYRRSEAEMPARLEEIGHAKAEGVRFRMLTSPVCITGDPDGNVTAVRCVEMELGEPDASGRRRPVPKAGSESDIEADTVIVAIGNSPNPLIGRTTPGLEIRSPGVIVADEATGKTSKPGVFAGGDAVTGAATIILAMGAGKKAAAAIDEYLREKQDRTVG